MSPVHVPSYSQDSQQIAHRDTNKTSNFDVDFEKPNPSKLGQNINKNLLWIGGWWLAFSPNASRRVDS